MEVIYLDIKGTFTLGGQRFNSGYTPRKFVDRRDRLLLWQILLSKIASTWSYRGSLGYILCLAEMDNDQIPEPQQSNQASYCKTWKCNIETFVGQKFYIGKLIFSWTNMAVFY